MSALELGLALATGLLVTVGVALGVAYVMVGVVRAADRLRRGSG